MDALEVSLLRQLLRLDIDRPWFDEPTQKRSGPLPVHRGYNWTAMQKGRGGASGGGASMAEADAASAHAHDLSAKAASFRKGDIETSDNPTLGELKSAWDNKPPTSANRQAEKAAGEAHLHAARLYENLGDHSSSEAHKIQAAYHAADAGSDWDESKHPRNENGEFD